MKKHPAPSRSLDDAYIRKEKTYIILMFAGILLIGIIAIGMIAYMTFFYIQPAKVSPVLHPQNIVSNK